MEEGKRRALICNNAAEHAKKQLDREVPPTEGMAQFKKLLKRKPTDKGNHRAKKPQEVVTTNVGKKPTNVQVPPPLRHGAKKGLMTAQGLTPKKRPPLLHEDSCRAVGLLLSIIKADDYEYLGNHAIEAMGETGLFSLAQVYSRSPSLPSFIYCP